MLGWFVSVFIFADGACQTIYLNIAGRERAEEYMIICCSEVSGPRIVLSEPEEDLETSRPPLFNLLHFHHWSIH